MKNTFLQNLFNVELRWRVTARSCQQLVVTSSLIWNLSKHFRDAPSIFLEAKVHSMIIIIKQFIVFVFDLFSHFSCRVDC